MRAFVLAVLVLMPSASGAQCRLCVPGAQASSSATVPTRPLSIEVEAALDLGKATSRGGGGTIAIDERTGVRRVEGLVDLGGFAIKGAGRLTGEPNARVRVSLPGDVRLVAPDGSTADAVDLRTDLPPDARLGADGTLRFAFGARLVVPSGAAGDFRGRISITADYE